MPTTTGKIYLGSTLVSGGGGDAEWRRPADWLALPTVGEADQKFVGLMAIYPQANFAALSASAAYTVNWGDGTTTNHASGTTAVHEYDYSTISADTLSSRGYKQVIVTVTPQAGQNLTALSINIKHTQLGLQAYETGWLDIAVGSPNFSTAGLVIGGTETVRRRMLERVRIVNLGGQTNCANLFQNCFILQSVPLFNTAAVTSMTSMFNGCSSLQSVPLFNTAAVTSMNGMFNGCSSLQSVPLFNTAAVTSMVNMFASCNSLQSVPLFNTAAVTSMINMFNGCSSLQSVPLFNTAAVTNMTSMFNGCFILQSVPALVTTAVTSSANFNNMFNNCTSISRIAAAAFNHTFSVANCKLGPAQLNEIYTNLPTVSGQTITVTGNWGTAGHDPTIATAKGWTVTV